MSRPPAHSQSYNRYAYVLNNPLSLTAPSGYFFDDLFDFFEDVFDFIGDAIQTVIEFVKDVVDYVVTNIRTIAAIGASVILQNYPVVAGFVAGLISSGGDLKAGIIGGLTGAAFNALHGVHFGIEASFADIIGRSLAHGVVGGASSLASGGSFLSGFLSSGTTQAFSPLIGEFRFKPIRVAIAGGSAGRHPSSAAESSETAH